MTGNNEKDLKRTALEDNEAGQVTGGTRFLITGDIEDLGDTFVVPDLNPILVTCTRCHTEGHTAENCPNFSDS